MKTKIFFLTALIISVFNQNTKAQVCASNYDDPWQWASHATWFTGEGVFINFPGGTGNPVFSKKTANLGDNTNHAYEGTATFSDNLGNLMGWSNGRKLWRDDGGDGVLVADNLLAGNEAGAVGERSSAVQGIVAVRHPNIPDKIFIFTSDDALTPNTIGPHYSVYDINTQTSTNPVRLKSNVGSNYRSTEQIDATFHANQNDIWVIIRQSGLGGSYDDSRDFYAYLITCDGLDPIPVKSEDVVPGMGVTFPGGGGSYQAGSGWSQDHDRGGLKVSWDGTKVATGNHLTSVAEYDETIMVFDFNNATGILSNCIPFARKIGDWGWQGTEWGASYDVEWAPDSRGLYVSSRINGGRLLWFDTEAGSGTADEIHDSGKLISTGLAEDRDIKLGGNGNLYATNSGSSLREFAFANVNDLNNGVLSSESSLPAGGIVSRGLSNTFIPPIDYTDLSVNPNSIACSGGPVDLSVVWLCRGGSAEDNTVNGWSADCGACITDAANGIFDPTIAGTGTHRVYYQRASACSQIDSIDITVTGPCAGCEDTTLSNVIAPVCVDQTVDLSTYEVTSDAGSWSIVSTPAGSSPAVITGGKTFDATGADAGTYRIRFTLSSAPSAICPDSAERNIVVEELPTISLSTGPICDGETLTLDAGNVGSTYQWYDNGSAGGTGQTEDVTTVGPHKVVVTTAAGCIDSATTTVVVNSNPDVSITPPSVTCTNENSENLVGSPAGGNWYINDVISLTGQFHPGALGNGTHEIKYEYTDANGCSDIDSIDHTVNLAPDITNMPSFGPLCSNEGAETMTALPAGGQWYINDAASTDQFDPGLLGGGTHEVKYSYTDGSGCSDSDSVSITINTAPDVTIDPISASCDNHLFEILSASPSGGQWYINDVASTDKFDPLVLGAANHKVKYAYTDGSGCSDSDSVSVVINSAPTVNLGPDTFFCSGLSIDLDAGAGFASYVWSPSGSGQVNTVSSGAIYDVIVTDANGCKGYDTVVVDQNALPEVNLGSDIAICEADSITLDATHPDAASYLWTPNNENTATIKVGSTPETYGVTITDVDGCEFTTSRTISQEDLPVVDLGSTDTICDDLTKTLDAGAGVSQSYDWYLDGVLIAGETGQTIEADSGTYVVSVTTPLGCETRDTVLIDNYQLPVVDLGGDYEYCELDSVQLDAGNPTASHLWTPGGLTDQMIWVTAGTYTVIVTDTNGCINSDVSIVSENANPIVNLGANDSACVGLEIELDATVSNGVSYVWSNGHNDAEYTLVGPDTLSVIATDANGCIGYDTIQIAALDSLDLSFSGDNQVCQKSESDHPLDAGSFEGATYTWEHPDGTTENGRVIVPYLDGWYKINVTDKYNCKGLDSVFNIVIPVPNISLGDDTSFCSLGKDTYTVKMEFTQNIIGQIDWLNEDSVVISNNNANDSLFTATYAPSKVIGRFIDDATGCVHIDTVELTEYCDPTIIKLPNVFVPGGGTGGNTTFRPIDMTDENFIELVNNIVWSDFQVYNRWGLKVFQSNDIIPNWDGTFENRPVASGVYYWIYKYKDSSLEEYHENGFVQVIQQRD